MFLELVRMHEKGISEQQHIKNGNQLANSYNGYANSNNFESAQLSPIKKEWLAYPFFNPQCFTAEHRLRKKDIQDWIKQHGKEFFEPLRLTEREWALIEGAFI